MKAPLQYIIPFLSLIILLVACKKDYEVYYKTTATTSGPTALDSVFDGTHPSGGASLGIDIDGDNITDFYLNWSRVHAKGNQYTKSKLAIGFANTNWSVHGQTDVDTIFVDTIFYNNYSMLSYKNQSTTGTITQIDTTDFGRLLDSTSLYNFNGSLLNSNQILVYETETENPPTLWSGATFKDLKKGSANYPPSENWLLFEDNMGNKKAIRFTNYVEPANGWPYFYLMEILDI